MNAEGRCDKPRGCCRSHITDAYDRGRRDGAAAVRGQLRMFVDATPVCHIHGSSLDVDGCRQCFAANEIRVYDDTLRADILDAEEQP